MTLAPPDSRTKDRLLMSTILLLPAATVLAIGYQVLVVVLNNRSSCLPSAPPCAGDGFLFQLGKVVPFLIIMVWVMLLAYFLLLRYLRGLKDPLEGEIKS